MPYLIVLLAWLAVGPAMAQDSAQPLTGDRRWIVLASRQNIDDAIGIARSYQDGRVFSTRSGWFAIVAGPSVVTDPRSAKAKLIREQNYPKDLQFSKGDTYQSQVWRQAAIEPLKKVALTGDAETVSLIHEGTTIVVSKEKISADETIPTVVGQRDGKTIFALRMKEASSDRVNVIVSVRKTAPDAPAVIHVEAQTGGAHCCTANAFIVPETDGKWTVVEGLTLDGEGYRAEDVDGDGRIEFTFYDNSFLYAFSSYAGSVPPMRVARLDGAVLKDVTREMRYLGFHQQNLAKLNHNAERYGMGEVNGFLAGWMATKTLLDEAADAWPVVLRNQERDLPHQIEECTSGAPLDKCPAGAKRVVPFAEALLKHLKNHGYDVPANLLQAAAPPPRSRASAARPALPPSGPVRQIPAAFHGHWVKDIKKDCPMDGVDISADGFEIGPSNLAFRRGSLNGNVLGMEMHAYWDDNTPRRVLATLVLSDDSLTIAMQERGRAMKSSEGPVGVHYRCPNG